MLWENGQTRAQPRSSVKKAVRRDAAQRPAQEDKPVSAEQVQHFANRITVFLKKAGGRPVSRTDLAAKCRGRGKAAYLRALKQLTADGLAAERGSGYVWAESAGMYRGVIVRMSRTFGFAKRETDGSEGSGLKGRIARRARHEGRDAWRHRAAARSGRCGRQTGCRGCDGAA